jgi:hypothetical protein
MHVFYLFSMEEVKKAQDKDGSVVAKAARVAKANKIDAVTLALYREVFDIVDFAVSKQWNSGAGCKGRREAKWFMFDS